MCLTKEQQQDLQWEADHADELQKLDKASDQDWEPMTDEELARLDVVLDELGLTPEQALALLP
jgi:hypothetical protein